MAYASKECEDAVNCVNVWSIHDLRSEYETTNTLCSSLECNMIFSVTPASNYDNNNTLYVMWYWRLGGYIPY